MSEKIKVSCECGHKFPVNKRKHRFDSHVYCPRCKAKIENPGKIHLQMPKFSLGWVRKKLAKRKAKAEAKEVLERYFKTIDPKTGKTRYTFPLNSWMKGRRPTVDFSKIGFVLGVGATREMILAEAEELRKLGVKIIGDFER